MSKGTTRRTVRIEDELWDTIQARTEAEGINASDLIRQLLRDWIARNNQEGTK